MTRSDFASCSAPYVPILLYHSVADHPPQSLARFTVSGARFAEHMGYLADNGYRSVSVAQLVDATQRGASDLPERPVVITFDDGFADFANAAWPSIRQHGLTATLYMVSAYVGGVSEWLPDRVAMLRWADLADLAGDGCEIGAHTEHHRALDVLPARVAFDEMRRSKEVLEDGLGSAIDTFAYPFGHHDRTARDLAEACGFGSACAVKNRLSSVPDDPFALARVTVTADVDCARLARILDGEGVAITAPGEAWRTSGYRWFRRAKGHLGRPVRTTS